MPSGGRLAAAAVLAAALGALPAAAAGDRVHYVLGGTMSGPYDVALDLGDGRFVVRHGTRQPGSASTERSGTFAAADLAGLRRLGTAVVTDADTPAQPLRPGERRPSPCVGTPDALYDLTVVVDGRNPAAAGAMECRSAAVAAFIDRMLATVAPRP